jgi:hypothetical protein
MVAAFHSLVGAAAAAASIASVMAHAGSPAELLALDGLHKVSNPDLVIYLGLGFSG